MGRSGGRPPQVIEEGGFASRLDGFGGASAQTAPIASPTIGGRVDRRAALQSGTAPWDRSASPLPPLLEFAPTPSRAPSRTEPTDGPPFTHPTEISRAHATKGPIVFRSRLLFLCSLLLLIPLHAGAEYLGDPNDLQVFIGDDGTFGEITLDNTVIDSLYPQRQFANGEELVADGNGVTVDPTGAYYTATITDFQIDVRSVIRGPLNLTTAPNYVFEQYFTFTNTSGATRSLESVAFYQSYLDDTLDDDVVQQDSPRPIVYSTDAPSGQLVALTAREQTYTSGRPARQPGDRSEPRA